MGEIVLCPDDFRKVLTGQAYYGPAEDSVWSHVKTCARVLAGAQDRTVYIDATHLTIGSRAQWIKIAQDIDVPIRCVHFDIPFDRCLERNKQRLAVVPDSVMERMAISFVSPAVDEGFASIKIITEQDQKEAAF